MHPQGLVERHPGLDIHPLIHPPLGQQGADIVGVGGDAGAMLEAVVEQAQLQLGMAGIHGAGRGTPARAVGADGFSVLRKRRCWHCQDNVSHCQGREYRSPDF